MNRINTALQALQQSDKIGLMTHVVVGYPSINETIQLVETMAACGVSFVELQIPFSDPLDGPTIMRANEISLAQGARVKDSFAIMKKLSQTVSIPLLFMAYYNTIFRYGVEAFCRDARDAGASGLIVPDMPLDEEKEEHFFAYCKQYNLFAIHLVSPASTPDRLAKIASVAEGFVYCQARQGTTGARDTLDPEIVSSLQRVKQTISLPLSVGFGIAKREHIEQLQGHAQIAIIGSAIIDVVREAKEGEMMREVRMFLDGVRGR
jgi:tryptophan synthase alpha subunit